MSARSALAALAVAAWVSLPAAASGAIVPKWQTAPGVNYWTLAQAGYINGGDVVYKLITGELGAGSVPTRYAIGIRSAATGALLAQTASSNYYANSLSIKDIDADGQAEIIIWDVSGYLICFNYTVGSSTLVVRWSIPIINQSGLLPYTWVDFDGIGKPYLVVMDASFNNKFHVYHNSGVEVATLTASASLSGPPSFYVGDFNQDEKLDLLIGYTGGGTYPSKLDLISASATTAVEPGTNSSSVQLGACYPNPMFHISSIDYTVPTAGQASLRLFDVAGREVRTLVNGKVTAGSHQATWDGRDANGRQAPAGVYFYQIDANGERASRRITRLQ